MLASLERQQGWPHLVPFATWTCVLTVPHTHEPFEKKVQFFLKEFIKKQKKDIKYTIKGMKEFTIQISQPNATKRNLLG